MKRGQLGVGQVVRVRWLAGVVAIGAATYAAGCSGQGEAPATEPARVPLKDQLGQRVVSSASVAGWREQLAGRFLTRFGGSSALLDASALRLWDDGSAAVGVAPSIALTSMTRGERDLGVLLDRGARAGARGVEIERGVAVERLQRAHDGIEQSWTFAGAPSGRGDLVLRLQVREMSAQGWDEQGLSFSAGERRLRYGQATWVDAHGQRTKLDTRFSHGQIVLTVPESVLDAAAYPAVLDPTLSEELLLATPPHLPGGYVPVADFACNGSSCLYVWGQNDWLVGRRISLDGASLDDKVLYLGDSTSYDQVRVSAGDNDYQVVWATQAVVSPIPHPLLGVSVSATTGEVSDRPPVELVDGDVYPLPVASTYGSGVHFVVYQVGGHNWGLRVVDNQVQAPVDGIDLGAATAGYVALGQSPNQFAFVAGNQLTRIDAKTGDKLDATPIVFTTYGYKHNPTKPAVVFDGTNYVLVWIDNGNLYASRVRASDGAVLDPDDDFNELPGARKLCASASGSVAVGIANANLHVTTSNVNWVSTQAFALAPWTSANATCAPDSVFYNAPMPYADARQVGAKGALLLWYSDGIVSRAYKREGSTVTTTEQFILNYYTPYLATPAIASNGRDFVVTGYDNQTTSAYVSAVDGATGTVTKVDASSLKSYARPAASGADFLLAYGDYDKQYARKLSCDLELGAAKQLPTTTPIYGLVGDGERYYLMTSKGAPPVSGYRLDADGNALDAPQTLLADGFGTGLAVDTTPTPDKRTFVVFGRNSTDVLAVRVRAATGSVLAPVTVDHPPTSGSASLSVVSSDGTNMLLAWDRYIDNQTPNEVWGASFNPTNGAVSGAKKLANSVHFLTFDGTSHLDWWADVKQFVRRLDGSFGSDDPAGGVPLMPAYDSVIASNAHGRSLVAQVGYKPEELGSVYVGRFVDNELSNDDPEAVPSNCVTSGVGGEGGAGGEGGVAAGGTSGSGGTSAGTSSGGTVSEAGASLGGASDGNGGEPAAGAPSDPNVGGSAGTAGSGTAGSGTGGAAAGTTTGGASTGGGSNNVGGSAGTAGGPSAGTSSGGSDAGGADGSAGTTSQPGSDSKNSSGCGCRLAPSSPSAPWHLLLGLLVFARRRRASSRPA